jgi:hypothetical protein
MSYIPNFSDSRVQDRLAKSIKFCEKYLRADKSQWISTRWIDHKDNFGMSGNQLSKFLREKLLVEIDPTYNMHTGKCKSYMLNQQGFDELKSMLITHTIAYSVIDLSLQHQTELETGNFEYNEKSSRLYHPIQNYPRESKKQLLAEQGYCFNYDIVCAMPTLIHQYSQQIPEVIENQKWKQGPMDLYLFNLRRYLQDRKVIRDQLATGAEVDSDVIKRLINGLFNGGQISHNTQGRSFAELQRDHARIEYLKQHEFVRGLIEDIKICWQYIVPTLPPRYGKPDKNGVVKRIAFSSKRKSSLYRDLERQVLDSVRVYLDQRGIKYFCEHDGWSTDQEVNLSELKQHIANQTGFEIDIEQSC